MADRTGGKILDQATIDAMNAQGEASRKLARQPLRDIAKRRRMRIKERKRKKQEDMKKLSVDAGTTSRTERGKGI